MSDKPHTSVNHPPRDLILGLSRLFTNPAPVFECHTCLSRKPLLPRLISLTLVLIIVPGTCCRPNIVLFVADDLGYGDLSCYGHPTQEFGSIDVLARDGMRFTQMYAAASFCTPSRAAMLTGRQPFRSGLIGPALVAMPNQAVGLDHDEITVAEVLQNQGYRTGFVGKWHLGINVNHSRDGHFLPQNQGFDFVGSFLPFSLVTQCDTSKGFMKNALTDLCFLYKNFSVVQQPLNLEKLSEIFLNDAKSFLHDSSDQPFFLVVSLTQTHTPMHSSPRFSGFSRRGVYGDQVNEMAWIVGEVMDTLKTLGLVENTLSVFVSDHGPHREMCRWSGHTGPFSGGKGSYQEGGLRIPAIFHWPGVISPGSLSTAVTSLMDLFPTFIALSGGDIPNDRTIDGRSLVNVIISNNMQNTNSIIQPHSILFIYDCLSGHFVAVRYGKYKIYFAKQAVASPEDYSQYCDVNGKPRKDFYLATSGKSLKLKLPVIYDIESDPSETTALSGPDCVTLLKKVAVLLRKEKQTWSDRKDVQLVRKHLNRQLIPCCNPPFCVCNYNMKPHSLAQCERKSSVTI